MQLFWAGRYRLFFHATSSRHVFYQQLFIGAFFPQGTDWYYFKAGDKEGLVESPTSTRKSLAYYPGDYPDLFARIKNKQIAEDEMDEKTAEMYGKCN